MKIQAVNFGGFAPRNLTNKTSNTNFNGILICDRSDSDEYEYDGMPSSYNSTGHYTGGSQSSYYTYYPFKNESEASIKKAIANNSYNYTSDCGGYMLDIISSCERGKTLPFTEQEWRNYPKKFKEKIESMLSK